MILVLGIISLAGGFVFLGPFAWIMGKGDLEKIDQGVMDPEGRGMTQAGMICGMIATAMIIVGLLVAVAGLAFLVLAAGVHAS